MLDKIKRDQLIIHKVTTAVGMLAGLVVAMIIIAKAEPVSFTEESDG